MKFFVYQPAPPSPDAPPPTPEMYVEMDKLIEDGTRAGVILATGVFMGQPTRVTLSAGSYAVTDGPFIEAKELMGGYTLIDVQSLEEAIGWVKRAQSIVGGGTNEICPVMSPEDFAAAAGQ
ncbi:MAG: YciI family protein [Anaerolineales bacterium]